MTDTTVPRPGRAAPEPVRRILCVCFGNICRSPMAQGVLQRQAAVAGLDLEIDSAGTADYHVGQPPDPRGLAVALARGYDNSGQRARPVRLADFRLFDLMVAMDRENLEVLQAMRPEETVAEIRLFDPDGLDIPDPYYGGPPDYDRALDMIEEAGDALIAALIRDGQRDDTV